MPFLAFCKDEAKLVRLRTKLCVNAQETLKFPKKLCVLYAFFKKHAVVFWRHKLLPGCARAFLASRLKKKENAELCVAINSGPFL